MVKKGKKQEVQVFGRKKTAVAAARLVPGRGLVKLNGIPIELVEPAILRYKVFEPLLLVGREKFKRINIRLRCNGGGYVSQIYALRQAIARGLVAYYQKYVDEVQKQKIKDLLHKYDRSLLVADPRRCEAKQYGGKGARSKRAKSYR